MIFYRNLGNKSTANENTSVWQVFDKIAFSGGFLEPVWKRESFQIFTNWVPYFGALAPYNEYSIICSYFGQSKHIRNTKLLV